MTMTITRRIAMPVTISRTMQAVDTGGVNLGK